MQKLVGIRLLITTAFAPLRGQVYHEVGVGFSGLRNWEVNPPEKILWDLNYY